MTKLLVRYLNIERWTLNVGLCRCFIHSKNFATLR